MESLLSSVIPNFVNGVSQQPYTLRLNSQGSVQENGLSTVSQGLKKRPPTKHIKKILNTPLTNAFFHVINRDLSEQYVVIIKDGDLKVFDVNGVEQVVNFPEGKGYLAASNASKNFSATTVADYTFIVNKTVVVKPNNLTTPNRPFEALVNVKLGNYGKTYKVFINGIQEATFTTNNGGNASDSTTIATDNIAQKLLESYNAGAGAVTDVSLGVTISSWKTYTKNVLVTQNSSFGNTWGETNVTTYTVPTTFYTGARITLTGFISTTLTKFFVNGKQVVGTRVGTTGATFDLTFAETSVMPTITAISHSATIRCERKGSTLRFSSAGDFSISVEDGFNGNAMFPIKGEVQNFNDLPTSNCFDGFSVKITNGATSEKDDYYAEWEEANGAGVWKESVKPGVSVGLYDDSMPWVLVRTSNGQFNFFSPQWTKRTVGDKDSAKDPSFVGKTISDVFFYRNRLGFISDESISLSGDDDYFNFYPKSVVTLLDSDRIDVTTSHTKVSNLKHAVGFNKQLLLFSEQTQFLVEDQDTLTPKNISVKVSTEFPCNVVAKPVGVGKNIYFVADKDEFSQVREYFPDSNNFNYDSLDVTGHIPKYIPSGVYKLCGAPNEDSLVALTANERNALYVYRFFWSGNDKLQSSWSKFIFNSNSTILNAEFLQSELLLVISRPDGVYLESMNFALGAIDGDEPYYIHLDRKVALNSTQLLYDAASGYTWVNTTALGYIPQYGNYKAIVRSGTGFKSGTAVDVVWDGTYAKMLGNWEGAAVTIGQVYTFKYTLSPITLRTQSSGGGQKSDTEGRLQIRKVAFNYADTGFFDIKVTPEGRDTNVYTFSGKKVGQDSGTIGTWNISQGRFQVPVITRNTTVDISIENSSPLPCSFLSADWEGMYVKRSHGV